MPASDTKTPTAAILSIGDELALGHALDTNSARIATELSDLGLAVVEHATVADDEPALTAAFERLTTAHDLLVVTGGLGPTADDLTRFALAAVLGDELVTDDDALTALKAWFSQRHGGMPEQNAVQAMRPASARLIKNDRGTAPGIAATAHGCRVFCLPGPPREMTPMFIAHVLPAALELAKSSSDAAAAHRSRLLLTFGMGESAIAERIAELMERDRPARGLPLVGTTASRGVVTCRVRGDASKLDDAEREIRDRLPAPAILAVRDSGAQDQSDPAADCHPLAIDLNARLTAAGQRLATVESCTGGLIGRLMTDVPGSSDAYAGGWVTYANGFKSELVGVPPKLIGEHGAVSANVAIEMAKGGLTRARQADITVCHALAVTGVAGPGGGTNDKPVGTVWIALATRDLTSGAAEIRASARRFVFRGGRESVRNWSALAALGMLRLRLMGDDMTLLGEAERVTEDDLI